MGENNWKNTSHVSEKKKANVIKNQERKGEREKERERERESGGNKDNAIHQTLFVCSSGIEERKERGKVERNEEKRKKRKIDG